MQTFKLSFIFNTLIILILFSACTGSEEKQLSEKQILDDFSKFNQVSQDFFNSSTRGQCACLGQYHTELKIMLHKTKYLVNQLESKKVSLKDNNVEKDIENYIYPFLKKYNSCLTADQNINPEVFATIEEDLKIFAGASAPGGKSDRKMRRLSVVLLKKHCNDLYDLGFKLDRLLFLISPGHAN
jgi:hypothetical protein